MSEEKNFYGSSFTGAEMDEAFSKVLNGELQDKLVPDETIAMQGGCIGVKTPVKPLTQAEYDALTEEEKQAGAVYLVDEPPWLPVPLSIQEYDTEDGWHVRKWSDGYAEQTLTGTFTPEAYDLFVKGIDTVLHCVALPGAPFPFPLPFTQKYSESAALLDFKPNGDARNLPASFMAVSKNGTGSLSQTNSYEIILKNNGQMLVAYTFSICAAGRWK